MEEWRKVEAFGLAVFAFFYTFVLLGALYLGVTPFVRLAFFAIVFLFCVLVLWVMIDRLDIPVFRVDAPVVIATVLGAVMIFFMMLIPWLASWVVANLGIIMPQMSVDYLATTLLFVSVTESMLKFIWVHAARELGLGWSGGIITAGIGFALMHVYRYGFGPAFWYVMILGFILLSMGRLPKVLGSKYEYSLHPLVAAHTVHNLMVPAASVLL